MLNIECPMSNVEIRMLGYRKLVLSQNVIFESERLQTSYIQHLTFHLL